MSLPKHKARQPRMGLFAIALATALIVPSTFAASEAFAADDIPPVEMTDADVPLAPEPLLDPVPVPPADEVVPTEPTEVTDPVITPAPEPDTSAPLARTMTVQTRPDPKVWVCKVVRNEGAYVLKAGKQPIHVSANALDADVNPVPGAPFSDAQPSFVVASDDRALCEAGLPPVQFMTVAWEVIDADGNGDDWGQTLVDNVVTSTPSLNALDELLTQIDCKRYQVDVYRYTLAADKAKVDALIAGGVLNGPSNPVEEPLIPGGAGTAWKTVGTNGTCTPPVREVTPVAPTFTPPTCDEGGSVQGFNTDDYSWDVTGPEEATRYEAVPNEGVTLIGQTVWTFNIAQLTGEQCTPPPTPRVCESFEANHSTNLDHNGWTLPEGARYVEGGIEIAVPGDWAEVSISRPFVGPLADIGTGVDISATPIQYVGIHVTLSNGAVITYEEEGSYAGKWWSQSDLGVASGMGYDTFDTLEAIVAANPALTTVSMEVLYTAPTASTTVITEVKVGCVSYTFDYVPPTSVIPASPVWIDECGPDNGHWSYTDTAQYGYTETVNPDGSVTVTVAPKGWVVFPEGTTTSWTEEDSNTDCPDERDIVTPVTPTVTHQVMVCTADYKVVTTSGTVTIPVTTGGRYLLDGKVVSGTINLAPGTYTFDFEVVSDAYVRSDTPVNLTVVIKAATAPSCVKPPTVGPRVETDFVSDDTNGFNPLAGLVLVAGLALAAAGLKRSSFPFKARQR